MTHIESALIESWQRNCQIIANLCAKLIPDQLALKFGDDEMDIANQLCHIHGTRRWWISQIDPDRLAGFERLHVQVGDDWEAVRDLDVIRACLPESGQLVLSLYQDKAASGAERIGPYTHPVMFLQHMLWHEGWHVGSILTILRLNGQELSEEWEDPNVWGVWRDPEIA